MAEENNHFTITQQELVHHRTAPCLPAELNQKASQLIQVLPHTSYSEANIRKDKIKNFNVIKQSKPNPVRSLDFGLGLWI